MDIERAFRIWCGPDVRYSSHDIGERMLRIFYVIPASLEPDRIFMVCGRLRDGRNSTKAIEIKKAALCAMQDGYLRSGRYDRDIRQLLGGKLA